jgi:hypothetical protein
MQANLPFGGWIRQDGHLVARELFTGAVTIDFPDGPAEAVPAPTGDLEAAFHATGASNVISYSARPVAESGDEAVTPRTYRSFGWARATGLDGTTAEALVETGDSYAFTAAASIRAVEETLSRPLCGAFSPAAAFGADLVVDIEHTKRTAVHETMLR